MQTVNIHDNIPIPDSDDPIYIQVIFGGGIIGQSVVSIYDDENKDHAISSFAVKTIDLFPLPKLNLKNASYTISIVCTAIDCLEETNWVNVRIKFYQSGKIISLGPFTRQHDQADGVMTFRITGKIFLKK